MEAEAHVTLTWFQTLLSIYGGDMTEYAECRRFRHLPSMSFVSDI